MSAFPASPASAVTEFNPLMFRATPRATAVTEAEAQKVGREFETMFLSQMLQPIFDTVEPDPVFGGGFGERMFRSLHVEQLAKGITRAGGIGLANSIAQEMLRMQEKANG